MTSPGSTTEAARRSLVPNVFAGLISGVMTVVAAISYATLICSGSLHGQLPLGIAAALASAAVVGIVVAYLSSSPFVVAGPDANLSAIFAVMAAAVGASLPAAATSTTVAMTLWAALAGTALLAGAFLYLVGRFRLGHWIRYIPYPVVGGFLAATGWLLLSGSFKVMCDLPLGLRTLGQLGQSPYREHWLPGLAFAIVLLPLLRRWRHFLAMPAVLITAILATHVVLLAVGVSTAQAARAGWLLQPFPQDLVFQFYRSLDPAAISAGALMAGVGHLLALLVVAAIVILLNAASVELATRSEVDLDQELKASGIANLVAAPLGALPGCLALSRTILNHRAGATSRLSGGVAALVSALVLLLGAPLLALLPRPVLGGLLAYLGMALLYEWVVEGWGRLSRFDYAMVVAIVVIVGLWGFLPGVGIGLLIACLLFAFNYSRIGVIRQAGTGAVFHSNVERSFAEQRQLRAEGEQVRILRLQGFLFFGTAYRLLVQVQEELRAPGRAAARYVVFDFSAVSGLDSSSALTFAKMGELVRARGGVLAFVGLSSESRARLASAGCLPVVTGTELAATGDGGAREFADLDHALGWCEEQLLRAAPVAEAATGSTIADHLAPLFPRPELLPRLVAALERMEVAPGQVVYRQGEPSRDLFFVESGAVTVQLELADGGGVRRLRSMGAGTVVGEMGVYLGADRSASVVAEGPAVLFRLTAEALARIEATDMELANALHRYFVRLLAGRLTHANEVVAHLQG
jgi:SulP family sulfate permease